ncbi:hypothetical protein BH11BAC6_BH11BAC6_16770 [soil metagenome]
MSANLNFEYYSFTMRQIISFLLIFATVAILGCSNKKDYPPATDALDAGREFIDACLKGEFDKAAFYMYDDSTNNALLLKQEKNYKEKSSKEKQEYHEASIIINENAVISDSVYIINYENSYDKTGRKVKVILRSNNWFVDFKYTFDGNL